MIHLTQIEVAQAELAVVLANTGKGLDTTRASAAENVAIVDENIRALDRRLAGIGMS